MPFVRIALIGAGATGCALLPMLCTLPLSRIRLIDGDTVEERNLPRQPLYGNADLGRLKVEVAATRVAHLRKDLEILRSFIDRKNIGDLLKDIDLVADCTDDLHAHRLLDEFCGSHKIPLITGAIHGRQLQVMTLHAPEDPLSLHHFFHGRGLSEQDACDMTNVPVEVPAATAALMIRRIRAIMEERPIQRSMDVLDLEHGHWLRIAPFDPDAEHELIAHGR